MENIYSKNGILYRQRGNDCHDGILQIYGFILFALVRHRYSPGRMVIFEYAQLLFQI